MTLKLTSCYLKFIFSDDAIVIAGANRDTFNQVCNGSKCDPGGPCKHKAIIGDLAKQLHLKQKKQYE